MAGVVAGAAGIHAGSGWSDPAVRTSEHVAFVGPEGQRILSFVHLPTSGVVDHGVVLCGSLYEDFQVNYRSELLVARALARGGCAAVRFHYRGVGNSDEIPGGMTFETMLADARAAATWLRERTGVPRPTVVGSRLGALVAARLASECDATPLVLWSPIVDGDDFFRGMSRASRLAGVRAEARKRLPRRETEARPAAEGVVEMLGSVVRRVSLDDLGKRSLPAAIGSRPVLLVQLGLGDSDNQKYMDLVSTWTADGATVDVLKVRMRQLWMVPDRWEPVEDSPTTQELVEGIVGWIAATEREPS